MHASNFYTWKGESLWILTKYDCSGAMTKGGRERYERRLWGYLIRGWEMGRKNEEFRAGWVWDVPQAVRWGDNSGTLSGGWRGLPPGTTWWRVEGSSSPHPGPKVPVSGFPLFSQTGLSCSDDKATESHALYRRQPWCSLRSVAERVFPLPHRFLDPKPTLNNPRSSQALLTSAPPQSTGLLRPQSRFV